MLQMVPLRTRRTSFSSTTPSGFFPALLIEILASISLLFSVIAYAEFIQVARSYTHTDCIEMVGYVSLEREGRPFTAVGMAKMGRAGCALCIPLFSSERITKKKKEKKERKKEIDIIYTHIHLSLYI